MDNLLDYDGLIYSVINRYSKRFDRDDLYQVGMLGLIEAYKNYKDDLKTKFSTYAYYYIVGEVNKYIRENSSLKVSRDLIKLGQSILKTREVMEQRLGREPANVEIALFLEIEEEKVDMALMALEKVKSLDYQETESEEMYNFVKVDEELMKADILDLKEALNNLDNKEQELIKARYFDELTQMETSKELGISQVQVSRKEAKILQKLRSSL